MTHDFTIANLGSCQIDSPLNISSFTSDDDRILFHTRLNNYSEITRFHGSASVCGTGRPTEKDFF